jgi:hypothetical protein
MFSGTHGGAPVRAWVCCGSVIVNATASAVTHAMDRTRRGIWFSGARQVFITDAPLLIISTDVSLF